MDGILVIDKPLGVTSHDMVSFTRRLFGIKKVGHTGTLDPAATGVLPVCIGKATKAADMLTASDKGYTAQMVLGMITDTLDSEGEILAEQPVNVTREEFEKAIMSFVGEIEQIPPMFSAIKQGGKKLYELAREGITVERKVRRVEIFKIEIHEIDMENYTATFSVYCSKGTYIRTLCEDIGMKLGCGGYMNTLRRIKSAGFTLEDSYTRETLVAMKEEGSLENAVIPIDRVFSQYKSVHLDNFLSQKAKNGVRIRRKGLKEGDMYRVYGEDGEFLCISRYEGGELILEKAFWN